MGSTRKETTTRKQKSPELSRVSRQRIHKKKNDSPGMATIESIHKEIQEMHEDIKRIKNLLQDDEGELTPEAKQRLAKARRTPLSEYVSLDEI